MPIRINRALPDAPYQVQWQEFDGFTRERHFNSYATAERFADQLACRLLIDGIEDLRNAETGCG